MIRFFPISFFLILVFSSCSLKTTEGLRESALTKTEIQNLYFSNPEIDYIYKSRIELFDKNFGGILILKKTGPASHRIVFTTEFGNKLFDFEIHGDQMSKNFIVKELDRKFIVRLLESDFKLLVQERIPVLKKYEASGLEVFKTSRDKRWNFYFYNKKDKSLKTIVNTTKSKEKTVVDFQNISGDRAGFISIVHRDIPLQIELYKI